MLKQSLIPLCLVVLCSLYSFKSGGRSKDVEKIYDWRAESVMLSGCPQENEYILESNGYRGYSNILLDEYCFNRDLAEISVADILISKQISIYDGVMKQISADHDVDWRLLSAIAYHESRFRSDALSHRGAQGLMQIMPIVAREFDVDSCDVLKPEVNVMLAAKLLKLIEGRLKIPEVVSQEDKLRLTLASYNGGVGRILDARKLAHKYGRNPNSWSDVSEFLTFKKSVEYHLDSVVKHGCFNGEGETLKFVDNVMASYSDYCVVAYQ